MKWLLLILSNVFVLASIQAQEVKRTKPWSLQDCLDYAYANNISIKQSELDKQTAEVNYLQSRNNRLPSLSAGGSGNISNGYTIDPITSDFVNRTIIANSYNLNAQMALYQGNRLNLEIQKNAYLLEQAELYQEQAKNSISLSVVEQYLQALYYYEGIQVAENTMASSKAELELSTSKYNNGAIARKDLADMETQYAQNQYNLSNSQSLYAQQVLRLKQLCKVGV